MNTKGALYLPPIRRCKVRGTLVSALFKCGGIRMRLRWISWAALVVLLSLVMRNAPARAESINNCIDSCVDSFNGSDQWELQQNCVNNCKNRVNYGAIAYAESNGAYGYSYDYHNAGDAGQRALSDCASEGDGCKVVLTFSETCAALAAGDNNLFAASVGDGAGNAQNYALTACSRKGGRNCAIKVSTCARD
jgi:hypothetical protein